MKQVNYHYKIKDWTLKPQSLELCNNEQSFNLQNKVIQVLIELIEANGQIVSNETLLKKVWKDTVVTQNSLNKAISELRKYFNDTPAHPKYIETIPRKGYRLLQKAVKVEVSPDPIKVKRKRRNLVFIGIITICMSYIVFNILLKPDMSISVLSPNGNDVAFLRDSNTGYTLFIENIVSGQIVELDSFSKPESIVLNWSSDNNYLMYNTTEAQQKFYSFSVINITTKKTNYIKFDKKDGDDAKHLNTKLTDSSSVFLDHNSVLQKNKEVAYINYQENDTIKVLFKDNLISDFKW